MPYMYILECCDGTYYTGSTWNLERRLQEHNGHGAGTCGYSGARYTRKRRPVKLAYYEEYIRIEDAFEREKQVQGWTKKKKEALICEKNDTLPLLAKKIWKKE